MVSYAQFLAAHSPKRSDTPNTLLFDGRGQSHPGYTHLLNWSLTLDSVRDLCVYALIKAHTWRGESVLTSLSTQ